MAGSSVKKSEKLKKKRKLVSAPDQEDRPSKSARTDDSKHKKVIHDEVPEEAVSSKSDELGSRFELSRRAWRNLDLILLLEKNGVYLSEKVEAAYNFVKCRGKEGGDGDDYDEETETVKVARLVVSLNNWVQTQLISVDRKPELVDGIRREACLDYRCWVIFKFCLEESLRSQVSLSFHRNLLQALGCVARNMCYGSAELSCAGNELEFRTVVFDCVSHMFGSHGRLSNDNLPLWVSTVQSVAGLVKQIFGKKVGCGDVDIVALKFSSLVLDAFANFLKAHPTRKNGFRDFVVGLLEPLLSLLGILHSKLDGEKPDVTRKLLSAVEEILANGIFHPTHMDEFLSLQSTGKYASADGGDQKELGTVHMSYRRHFFEKLKKVMAAKEESSLNGLGKLFHVLVDRLKRQKTVQPLYGDTKKSEETESSKHIPLTVCETVPNCLNAEKRKSIFNFFVEIMEPLLLEMNVYLQAKLELGPMLLDVHCTMKSVNDLLGSFLKEKLYMKAEDTSGGACLNFLKQLYDTIFSLATNILRFFVQDVDAKERTFNLLAQELLIAVGYLLEIEYEVTNNDLTSLWHMILSYLAVGCECKSAADQESFTFLGVRLGCQILKIYSELRQVTSAISTLCIAIRLVVTHENDAAANQKDHIKFSSSWFPLKTFGKTLGLLLSSQDFRLSMHNAIKGLPEGQASDCVQKLCVEVSESMQWVKDGASVEDHVKGNKASKGSHRTLYFDLREEIFGRLSEVYTVVLESLSVTAGNCTLVERCLKDLLATISPHMSILVGLQPDSVNEFIHSVTGRYRSKDGTFKCGHKRMTVVKKHIQSLISALFNIILHLQGPLIFNRRATSGRDGVLPDPGAVILMSAEVLTRVSVKSTLFHLESSHVAQSLHVPAALFQDFSKLMDPCLVDRRFSIDLYAACCRLLSTVLKYRRNESEPSVALLQESSSVLLHCLETVNTDSDDGKGYFSWNTDEGVKCACFFRRIYEELRQQRDVFGKYCSKFLYSYICVYTGNGPRKTGIKRELDEALKPGVYALIDACSLDDLQNLHIAFGEGPCRNTLSALQHGYKLNFQYAGKV
ncbi:hypothetical protein LINGRAHAP2_LOCUS26115 [Linum grandiflorum]